jgi:hypothetical protein
MAAKWTADWVNRLFILKAGVTEIDVQIDLYSDWKEEVAIGDNMKHPIAMRSVGGDPISDIQNLGATYFLTNNWRIRPHEADHELVLTGNLFSDPAGVNIVVPTLGDFTVLVTNVVSNLVDSSVARLDLTQLLDGVYIDTTNGEAGTVEGIGTPTRPVNNITDARIIADRDNLRAYVVVGSSITLDRDYIGWKFTGTGNSLVNLGGFNAEGTEFDRIEVVGTNAASPAADILIDEGRINGVSNFRGFMRRTVIEGTITLVNDTTVDIAAANDAGTPIFDCTNCTALTVAQWSGGIELRNITSGTFTIDMVSGHLTLDSTCTGGTVTVRGVGKLTDNSGVGLTTDIDAFVEGVDVRLSRKILQNRTETDPVAGVFRLFDDDGTVLFTVPLWENIAGTQAYQGQGADRRERIQ